MTIRKALMVYRQCTIKIVSQSVGNYNLLKNGRAKSITRGDTNSQTESLSAQMYEILDALEQHSNKNIFKNIVGSTIYIQKKAPIEANINDILIKQL